jgi:hypothetical protein
MTVAGLIDILHTLPQSAVVWISRGDEYEAPAPHVKDWRPDGGPLTVYL